MTNSDSMKQYTQSIAAFQEAQKHIPGGVNSPVRSFRSVDGDPLFIASAKGAKVFDIDGHEYIDYVGSWGTNDFGSCPPRRDYGHSENRSQRNQLLVLLPCSKPKWRFKSRRWFLRSTVSAW